MHIGNGTAKSAFARLFLASFLALFFELVIIRYLSSEIRVFAYLKNLPLVASFFGLGLGMVLGKNEKLASRIFPFTTLALFLLIHFAPALNLTHLPFPTTDYIIWGVGAGEGSAIWQLLRYTGVITLVSALVVFFCIPLGSRIGTGLEVFKPLKGYGIDLAGSVAGIGLFTLLAFLQTPPWLWVAIGCAALLFVWWEYKMARLVFFLLPVLLFMGGGDALWSPYYRISLKPGPVLSGESDPSVISVSVNYDYHQKVLDLSDGFFARHPGAQPNAGALLTYDFPYLVHPNPERVLIVGAGTGNDVASALRHGAAHVDAVEIDPVILGLGKTYHPEHPYDSPNVSIHINDARAFLKEAKAGSYDLVIFAYLDAHTLLANSSSLRLDNYVYTAESIVEAKDLLKPDGTLVLAFAAGKSFANARMFGMVKQAFGEAPTAYFTNYDGGGVVFVSRASATSPKLASIPLINDELEKQSALIEPATDSWPFLYLQRRGIPASYSIVFVLLFLGWVFGRRALNIEHLSSKQNLHFFMLGAAFLLLETKAVTELSLLFGSTWLVNTIAIAAFLGMAIAANTLLMRWVPQRKLLYILLFASLVISIFFPLTILGNVPFLPRIFLSGAVLALPVFFSGMLFSRAFRDAQNPGQALGVNLLGALVGGVAENTVMIGGTMLLGGLAILFYAVSLFAITEFGYQSKRP